MPYVGELSALLVAFLWSGTSIVFSAATRRVGATRVNITRLVFALVFLSLTIPAFGLGIDLSATQVMWLVISGLIGLAFGDQFLFLAFHEIGARLSMLIMALAPAMSAVLAWIFLGETLGPWGIAGIVVTIAGIAVVVLERPDHDTVKHHATPRGLTYAFLGALGQAVGLIFAKLAFLEGDIHGLVATFVRIAASVAVMLPIALFSAEFRGVARAYAEDRRALLFTAIGAVIGPYLGITFSLVAISHTNIAIAATIMAMPPIIMLPMVRIAWREHLSWKAVAGAVVAVIGVGVLFLR